MPRQFAKVFTLLTAFVALFAFTHILSGAENDNAPFVKTANQARQKYTKDGTTAAQISLGPWYAADVIKGGTYNDAPACEKSTDLNEKVNGKPMWKLRNDYADDKANMFNPSPVGLFYMARIIQSDRDQKLKIQIGSDDGFSLYLNGKRVAGRNVARGVGDQRDAVTLDLKKGDNFFNFKVYNSGGAGGFYFKAIQDFPTQAQWNAIGQEYPECVQLLNNYDPTFGPQFLMSKSTKALTEAYIKRVLGAHAASFIAKLNDKAGNNLAVALEAAAACKEMDLAKIQLPLIWPEKLKELTTRLEESEYISKLLADEFRAGIDANSADLEALTRRIAQTDYTALPAAQKLINLQKRIVFSDPAVKELNDIAIIRRGENRLGIPQNYQGHSSISRYGYDNEIGIFNAKTGAYETIYRPDDGGYVGDLELHFDAERMLFSGATDNHFQVYELDLSTRGARKLTDEFINNIDNYEPMYLPDEKIIFTSSATFVGVPCVTGVDYVGNIHRMNADGTGIRRLCFDQDNNWCPVLLVDGRIMYLRWEYTDSAHYFSRVLMNMNPDGTGQKEFYGSNSYWPNSLFYARPLPGSTNKFVSVVAGHHTNHTPRTGELYLFDTAKGRKETTGVVQAIAPKGAVPPSVGRIEDRLPDRQWPKFCFPHPLSETQFLVSAKLNQKTGWGLYIIDLDGNMTLLRQEKGYAMFEPTPIAKTKRPPVIPDKVNLASKDATLFIQDIYSGEGTRGIPRGVIKAVRIFQYEYSYRNTGGHYVLGMDGPWDVRRVLGTVPVLDDGSVICKVPANVPLAIQPLDENGCALQQFRSWLTAMPGEYLQCLGCHESQNEAVPVKVTQASRIDKDKAPAPTPFYGQKRGFSYEREVQPVLNRYCISCHDADHAKRNPNIPDFADSQIRYENADASWGGPGAYFSRSYWNLMPYVRRNGPEGDYSLLAPAEFHPRTSRLVQILEKGHYGVEMDKESWDKILTWIDMNVPYYGTWNEMLTTARAHGGGKPYPNAQNFDNLVKARAEARKRYGGVEEDIEAALWGTPYDQTPVAPKPVKKIAKQTLTAQNWPFDNETAKKLQEQAVADGQATKVIDLGNGQQLTFVRIPAGEFNMGSERGYRDELPVHTVKIEKPFWMCTTEVSLADYRQFDKNHKNGFYDQHYKDQVRPGYNMDDVSIEHEENAYSPRDTRGWTPITYVAAPDRKNFPVIRVSWNDAMDFCQWLSEKSGEKVTLPTEAQWEWAARAGSDKPFFYGGLDDDFTPYANLADKCLEAMAVQDVDPRPINPRVSNKSRFDCFNWELKDARFHDGYLMLAQVNKFAPNAFGLKNMIGNAAEWCRDTYRPYPYKTNADDANRADNKEMKVLRGGSWYSRPKEATSSYRLSYPAWMKVYDATFRPIIEE